LLEQGCLKFPKILDEIATEAGKTFAIFIDEAHSSQGGKTSAAMSQALGGAQDAGQRQLLRVYRDAQEQDAGDVR
jgi:hypothetical protein